MDSVVATVSSGEASSGIRVVIADDHPVVRNGLRHILTSTPDIVVAAEASNAATTLDAARQAGEAVLVLDLSMPGADGLDLLMQVRHECPDIPVLILTMYAEDHFAIRALRAGAAGYLVKESAPEELVSAVRKVSAGGRYVSPALAEKLAGDLTRGSSRPPHETLSDREYQIFRKLASGKSTRAISEELTLSIKTVATYRARVFEKLGMRSNAELATYAVRNRLD
jgi:DNA-binding NarL/FixJ family response regulator